MNDNQIVISAANKIPPAWSTLDEQVIAHFLIIPSFWNAYVTTCLRQGISHKPPVLTRVRSLCRSLLYYEIFINLTCIEFATRPRWVQTPILQTLISGQIVPWVVWAWRGTSMYRTKSQFSWYSKVWRETTVSHNSHRKHTSSSKELNLFTYNFRVIEQNIYSGFAPSEVCELIHYFNPTIKYFYV